jgi:hypothetical protein
MGVVDFEKRPTEEANEISSLGENRQKRLTVHPRLKDCPHAAMLTCMWGDAQQRKRTKRIRNGTS